MFHSFPYAFRTTKGSLFAFSSTCQFGTVEMLSLVFIRPFALLEPPKAPFLHHFMFILCTFEATKGLLFAFHVHQRFQFMFPLIFCTFKTTKGPPLLAFYSTLWEFYDFLLHAHYSAPWKDGDHMKMTFDVSCP